MAPRGFFAERVYYQCHIYKMPRILSSQQRIAWQCIAQKKCVSLGFAKWHGELVRKSISLPSKAGRINLDRERSDKPTAPHESKRMNDLCVAGGVVVHFTLHQSTTFSFLGLVTAVRKIQNASSHSWNA